MRSMITSYSRGSSWRVPPRDTNSATTSASRRLTSSMKAGGKDHSRPTIRPTFTIMWCVLRSVVAGDVLPDHVLPVRPVVRPSIPGTERVRNPLPPECARKPFVVGVRGVIAADRQDDVDAPDGLESLVVRLVADEVGGVRVVDVSVR